MFSRIREAVRIITYREPESGPDAVIAERVEPSVPAAGKIISYFFEVLPVIYVIARISGPLGNKLEHLIPGRTVALTTLAGAVGALLMLMVDWLKTDIQQKISSHINLTELLAPFFGHRLDNASRVLRGSTRAS